MCALKVGLEGDIARLTIDPAASGTFHPALDDRLRQYAWEHGQIDYKGADAFDNIRKRLDEQLANKNVPPFNFAGTGRLRD